MKETKINTSLLSLLTLEPRNKSLVRSIIILLSEKTRTQYYKRWAGFNDNLDFESQKTVHRHNYCRETKHALNVLSFKKMPI